MSRRNVEPAQIASVRFTPTTAAMDRGIGIEVFRKGSEFAIDSNGGLYDKRMGATNSGFICETCHNETSSCPGHMGYIALAMPVPKYIFLKDVPVITNLLKVINLTTWAKDGTVTPRYSLAQKKLLEQEYCSGKDKFLKMVEYCEKIPIDGILHNFVYDMNKHGNVIARFTKESTKPENDPWKKAEHLTFIDVYDIFSVISAEIMQDIGLDGIEAVDYFYTVMPVTPPSTRPYYPLSNTDANKDDMTTQYGNIIAANDVLRETMKDDSGLDTYEVMVKGEKKSERSVDYNNLCIAVFAMTDSDKVTGEYAPDIKHNRPITVKARWNGNGNSKQGRVRKDVIGKRGNGTMRTVISPSIAVGVHEIGVPLHIMKSQSVSDYVIDENVEGMNRLLKAGVVISVKRPGVGYVRILRKEKKIIEEGGAPEVEPQQEKETKAEITELLPGDVIRRQLLEGDIIIVVRQPTLHAHSFKGYRVVSNGDNNTIVLNPANTEGHNADFDGDEMTGVVLQAYAARIDAVKMTPMLNIINRSSSKPIVKFIQDTVLAASRVSMRKTIPQALFHKCVEVMHNGRLAFNQHFIRRCKLERIYLYSGRALISMTLPYNMFLKEKGIHIRRGIVISRTKIVKGTLNKIIAWISQNVSAKTAQHFFNDFQRVMQMWLLHTGMTIGIKDLIPDPAEVAKVKELTAKAMKNSEDIARKALLLKDDVQTSHFESEINSELNNVRSYTSKVTATTTEHNRIAEMTTSGAKGSKLNVTQLLYLIGQQNLSGGRLKPVLNSGVAKGRKSGKRVNTHNTFDNISPVSRGFVTSSYAQGMTPEEYFGHSRAGREALNDQSTKMPDSGYLQRRLARSMEDSVIRSRVNEFGRRFRDVEDEEGRIIQFMYGMGGKDPAKVKQLGNKYSIDFEAIVDIVKKR